MKKRYLLFALFLLIPSVSAYQGIVINNSNIVIYKFDTQTLPILNNGEVGILRNDINDINVGARYYLNNGTYINPLILTPQEITDLKNQYIQAITDLDLIQSTTPAFNQSGYNKLIWAVQREAQIEELILKFLKVIYQLIL